MSEEIKSPQESEEVDLGQLLKSIGNAFNKLFKFIGSILNKLFLAFVWCVFFVKRHFIVLVVAAAVGFAYGLINIKLSEPVFSTNAIIKQNYNSGEAIYNQLNYYNNLISDRDTTLLASTFDLTPSEASSIVSFGLKAVINENSKLKVFDNFKKTIDTTIAKELDIETFLDNNNEYDYEYQRLTINSTRKGLSKKILPIVINKIKTIDFFENLQEKDLNELRLRDEAIRESLIESDSLKQVYKRVLEKKDILPSSQTNISITSAKDESKTREFDLFKSDLELRRELVEIDRRIKDKEKIIEVVSNQQEEVILANKGSVFGKEFSLKYYFAILTLGLAFFILLMRSFLKFLEKFKDKI